MAYTLEQLQKMGATPLQGTPKVPSPGKVYTLDELKTLGATPLATQTTEPTVVDPNGESDKEGFLKTMVKAPIKSLIVKPIARTTEALGRLGVFGETIKKGYEEIADEGQGQDIDLNIPGTKFGMGRYKVENVKSGTSGAKQVAGEALEAASYLMGGGAAKNVGKEALKQTTKQVIKRGAIEGAKSGAAFSGGQALQKDLDAADIAKETIIGAGVGAAAGAALPTVVAGAKATARGARSVFRGARNATETVIDTAGRVPGKITETLERSAERSAKMKAATPEVREAMRTDIDDNIINFVEGFSDDERRVAGRMTTIAKEASENLKFADSPKGQPKRLIGEEFLKRVKTISEDSRRAGEQIKRAVLKNPDERIEVMGAVNEFFKRLSDNGILPKLDASGNIKGFYSTGKVPSTEMKYYDQILKEIIGVTRRSPVVTKKTAHQLRQRLFETLSAATREGGKPGSKPFSDAVDSDVNFLRSKIAELIGGSYQRAAKRYAMNESALREVAKMAGVPNSWDRLAAKDLRIGEILMRVLGNAKDRPQALIDAIEDLARARGGQYGTNMNTITRFADLLEDVYGNPQTRSFRGQGARAGLDVVDETTGALKEAVRGNVFGAITRPIKTILGKSEEDKIRAFEGLVFKKGKTVFK